MLIRALVFLVLLSLTPLSQIPGPTAKPAKWVKVDSRRRLTTYIDVNSIAAQGDLRDVWDKMVEKNAIGLSVRPADVVEWRYDCKKRRSMMTYNGKILKNGTIDATSPVHDGVRSWDNIQPTSVAEAELKFVCAR